MAIDVVAYGKNSAGKYYVQTACDREHCSDECECKTIGENYGEYEAKKIAENKAKEIGVPVQKW